MAKFYLSYLYKPTQNYLLKNVEVEAESKLAAASMLDGFYPPSERPSDDDCILFVTTEPSDTENMN